MLAIKVITSRCVCNRLQKVEKLKEKIFKGLLWNSFISFVDESFLLMAISFFASIPNFTFNTYGKIVSANFSFVAALTMISYPIWVTIFLHENRDELGDEKFKEKYESAYENLDYKKSKYSLFEPLIVCFRIITFTASLIFLQDYPYFQMFIVNAQVTFLIIFIGLAEPYKVKSHSFFEKFNESFVIILNYHLLCFADFVVDTKTRNLVGWSMIVSIGICLFINMTFIIGNAIKDTYIKYRFKYYQWKLNRSKMQKKLRAE